MPDDRTNIHAINIKGPSFEEYIDNTLKDIKEIIMGADIPENDKRHFLDTIWILAHSTKDGPFIFIACILVLSSGILSP